jgi:hypothetical protein
MKKNEYTYLVLLIKAIKIRKLLIIKLTSRKTVQINKLFVSVAQTKNSLAVLIPFERAQTDKE